MQAIKINPSTILSFSKGKAYLDITSTKSDTNVAYKIKTTAPKLFVVKPIQGIVMPNATQKVEVSL